MSEFIPILGMTVLTLFTVVAYRRVIGRQLAHGCGGSSFPVPLNVS